MSLMRPVPLAALALAALPLFAQEKIEVSVVNVDVTVTDHGKPVPGLTKDDFVVLEDGVPQALTNFYAVRDNDVGLDDRFRRKVVLLIDGRTMTTYTADRALSRFEAFINDQFKSGDYTWSIVSTDAALLRVLMPPTSDRKIILDALRDIRQGQAHPSFETAMRTVALHPIDAIVEALRAFATTEGKKALIVLTAHIPDVDARVSARVSAYTREELIQEANASNVNIYVVNPEGAENLDSSMFWITRETGGLVLAGSKVDRALSQFDAVSGSFYSLGFRPTHSSDGNYHRLKVRVKNPNYALQYRDGYYDLSDQQQIERSLGSSFGTLWETRSAIPVTIAFEKSRDAEDAAIVSMTTTVPAEQPLGMIDIFVSVFDSDGQSVWNTQLTRDASSAREAGKYNEKTEMYLHKGKRYRVVVAVRDRTTQLVGVTQQVVQF